ncbi:histidine phosphotransferase [Mycena vitilis]|nr:histidine phosphotransferase [Mycena vitilis]
MLKLAPAPNGADSEVIDMETFNQLAELDEDGTHDFSRGIVHSYLSEASATLDNMDRAIADKRLFEVGVLGEFLKGTSATLGINKVQAVSQEMQLYGLQHGYHNEDVGEDEALAKMQALLDQAKAAYFEAERWLRKWYQTGSFEGVEA